MQKKIVLIASLAESLINFRLHLIKEFLARDYAVTTIAPDDAIVAEILTNLGVKFIAVPLQRNGNNPLNDMLLLKKLFFLIREEQPDIVLSYTIKPVIYGTLAAKLAGVKQIYAMLTGTGYIFSNNNLKSRIIGLIARNMFRMILRFNTKLFFQNKDNLAFFIYSRLIRKNQPVVVVNGSGVDIKHFYPVPLPSTISFLMIARLIIDKGIREYVEAARLIKKCYPSVVFKLVGWIDTNPNAITQQELCEWIESDTIQFLGKIGDVRQVITDTAIYVLPSYGEGTPRTVLEAMAMGRPIITTDVPGCRETVIEGENGLMVPVRNSHALAKAMHYFLENPLSIAQMGQKSRCLAEDKYDVNKVNQSILKEMEIQNDISPTDFSLNILSEN